MRLRRYVCLLLAVVFVASTALPVFADELDEKQGQLDSVQQQMEVQQNRANKAQRQVESVSEQLRQIQVEMDAAQQEYNNVQAQLNTTEQQIQSNTQILAKAEKNLAKGVNTLNKRVRDIYINGQISYLDVLLGSKDFSDFTTRMDILKKVIRKDIMLVNQVRAERALIIQKKAELEQDRALILNLKKTADAKKTQIASKRQEREKILSAAVSEKQAAEREYQDLMQTSQQIQQMLRRIQAGGQNAGGGGSGSMIWPVSGEITSPFGWRIHPIFGSRIYHSGLDIAVDEGVPIAAADSGVVVDAGWMGGYGKAVIIDHGGGISSLYGHTSALLVSEGQRVSKGQTIALVGSTGYSTGPHLHFEVRQDGEPVSPLSYLP